VTSVSAFGDFAVAALAAYWDVDAAANTTDDTASSSMMGRMNFRVTKFSPHNGIKVRQPG
jgi:hypothetical protein